MTHNKICVVIKGPSFKEAHEQIAEAQREADLVEIRLDYFTELNETAIKKLKESCTIPIILTLRDSTQGGYYQGTEVSRLEMIRKFAALKPDYLDIESHVSNHFVEEISQNFPKVKLIISYHNFKSTPQDIEAIYKSLLAKKAHLYKIAVTAENTLQALQLLKWLRESNRNVIAVSMGACGQISRILGPIFGNTFTYACLDKNQSTAPGQLTVKELKEQYRYSSINSATAIYGLIGNPIDQSLSHISHNHLFQTYGTDAVYVKMQVQTHELQDFIKLARQLPFKGLSVTIPLKEEVMKYIDYIDSKAKKIGAVNTLHFVEGKIKGYNTDCSGALDALEKEFNVKNKKILIVGAGGSSKAVAYEAHQRGAFVTIVNRDVEKAQRLAESLNSEFAGLHQMNECAKKGYDVLINCTPVPLPIELAYILPKTVIMDIKTKAIDTPLIQEARKKGCTIVYGYRMFVEQAVSQFEIWLKDTINSEKTQQILEKKVRDCVFKDKANN